jgi:hypothetical protein
MELTSIDATQAKHNICVLFDNGMEVGVEVVASGITDPPYRLWWELPWGERTYVMLDKVMKYTIY